MKPEIDKLSYRDIQTISLQHPCRFKKLTLANVFLYTCDETSIRLEDYTSIMYKIRLKVKLIAFIATLK